MKQYKTRLSGIRVLGPTGQPFDLRRSIIVQTSGPLGLNMTGVGSDSWADANRFGPGYLNVWAFGPESHSALHRFA